MPVNYCFYPNYVVLRRQTVAVSPGVYFLSEDRYFYATKGIVNTGLGYDSLSNHNDFVTESNTILDAAEVGTSVTIYTFVIDGSNNLIITQTVYPNRRLLMILTVSGSPVDSIEITVFNKNTKLLEVISSLTTIACRQDYVFAANLGGYVLASQCIGFDRKQWIWHGQDRTLEVVTQENSVACGYVTPTDNTQVTEEIRVKVLDPCINPVLLAWKNTKPGWDYWLFSRSQEIDLTTTSDGRMEVPYFDLSTLESRTRDLGKNQTNLMTLGAQNLTREEKNGIEKILVSPLVYQLNQDGSIMRYVKVLPGKFVSEPDTNQSTFSIEFTIELPETATIK